MKYQILICSLVAMTLGLGIQWLNIKLAKQYRLLDIPSARRRHSSPTPITGGVGIVLTWIAGLCSYSIINNPWIQLHHQSTLLILGCVLALVLLGLLDDLKGLTPFWKLSIEFVVAGVTVFFLPEVRSICEIWSATLGVFIWPIAMLWIVGITNSINLIDGLDGLAGGFSVLVLSSICVLCLLSEDQTEFPFIIATLLIPATLSFLRHNWSNAKIFLGDNGSLPLGFLIATCSLMCRPHSKSWVMLASITLMLGYPLLDMTLAVLRRFLNHQPLFKADRNHLHYKIQRLGLTKTQTLSLLLSIGLYLQLSALFVNLISPTAAILALVAVCCSIITLLHLMYSIELSRVKKLYHRIERSLLKGENNPSSEIQTLIHIELSPLLEVALLEEQGRHLQLMEALKLMLTSFIRDKDLIFMKDERISILLSNEIETNYDETQVQAVKDRLLSKIEIFLNLYELQCSLASIPVTIERIKAFKSTETQIKNKVFSLKGKGTRSSRLRS